MRRPFRRSGLDDPSPCALIRSATDPDAFAELYAAHAKMVLRFLARKTLDPELALDLTAETFALALEHRHQFRGSTVAEEQSWLFTIARRLALGWWRRGSVERSGLERLRVELPTFSDGQLEEVERIADLPELRRTLAAAVDRLPADQAHAVRERVMWERSYTEIAEETGVTEQVIRARVSRGLKTLARHLDALRPEGVT